MSLESFESMYIWVTSVTSMGFIEILNWNLHIWCSRTCVGPSNLDLSLRSVLIKWLSKILEK